MEDLRASSHGSSASYRPDIDGLRAIAVLLVVVFHFHLTSEAKSGFVGVDVFFVISGFLITWIVREQIDAQRFSLANFWIRRLRRLAPALFVVLIGVMAWAALRLLQADFAQLMHEVLAAQFYYANVYFWQNVNYFGLQAGNIFLLHTWSLAVEEQFYIVYPIALVLIYRHARRFAFWIVLAAAVASFSLNLAFVGSKAQATFYLMPTRAWELLIGALLTWAPALRKPALANVLGLTGALLVAVSIAAYDEDTRFPGSFALLPTVGAACLLHAGTQASALTTRLLSTAPMVAIGRISYSLYLVHWPVNVFASQELGDDYSLPWRLAMVALCFLISTLLYRFVETPLRHGHWLPRHRSFVATYGAGLVASVALTSFVILQDGLPGRLPAEVARIAAFAKDLPDERCAEYPTKGHSERAPLCTLGVAGKSPEWLIWGDSHAWAAQGAIDAWLKASDSAGRIAFLNSCPPLQGVHLYRGGPGCQAFNTQMLAVARDDPAVKKVFLVSTWRQAIEGKLTAALEDRPTVASSVALFQRQFDATIRELRGLGKEVYIWEPLPAARDHVPRHLASATLREQPVNLDFSRGEYEREYAFFFDALKRNRPVLTGSFSTGDVLCKTGTCLSVVEGRPVYFDNSHLAHSGSAFWAAALAAQLDGRAAPMPARTVP
jgi:peptidoglycan/LPS O-acetylase OafA/YrhL